MSRRLAEDYKALSLIPSQAITATVTGAVVNVEGYDDDALAIVSLGTYTSTPTVTASVTGAKTTTPTTYDQTLATFVAATATGLAALPVNLTNIANVKGVLTLTGGSSPSVPSSFVLMVKPFAKSAANNSGTLA